MGMNKERNYEARLKAIAKTGHKVDYIHYKTAHLTGKYGSTVGMTKYTLAKQYCLTRRIKWEEYLKEVKE